MKIFTLPYTSRQAYQPRPFGTATRFAAEGTIK
jgi:hypothetical protein